MLHSLCPGQTTGLGGGTGSPSGGPGTGGLLCSRLHPEPQSEGTPKVTYVKPGKAET